MGTALSVALILAVSVLRVKGTDANGLVMALRVTARWSFLLFWLAYVGSALSALFGSPFAALNGRGRTFGLAYAAAQTVHIGLVIRLSQILGHAPLGGKLLVFFLVGIAWTYLLAALSFGHLAEALGRRVWWTLRILGMNYILLAFAYDFVPAVSHPWSGQYKIGQLIMYLPFAVGCVSAPVLVLAAEGRRRLWPQYGHAELRPVAN